MKRRDLESKLTDLGWDWSRGEETIAVPRHNEINEITARKILKRAAKR